MAKQGLSVLDSDLHLMERDLLGSAGILSGLAGLICTLVPG